MGDETRFTVQDTNVEASFDVTERAETVFVDLLKTR